MISMLILIVGATIEAKQTNRNPIENILFWLFYWMR